MKKTSTFFLIILAFLVKINAQQPNSVEPATQLESPSTPKVSPPTSVAPVTERTHDTPSTPTNNHSTPTTNHSSSENNNSTSIFLENYATNSTTVLSTAYANAENRTIFKEKPTALEALQRLIVLCDDVIFSYKIKGNFTKYEMRDRLGKVKDYVNEMQFQTVYLAKNDFKKLRPILKNLEKEADEGQNNSRRYEAAYELRPLYDKVFVLLQELEKELTMMEETN